MSDSVLEDSSCFSSIIVLLINLVIGSMDAIQDRLGGHETSTIVNDESTTRIILVSRGLETAPNLHLQFSYVDWI